jgi:hypothetical protein
VKKQKRSKAVATSPTDTPNGPIIWRNCAIGALDAETDEKLLSTCYVDNGCLEAIRDIASSSSIILGRTGVGKSATIIRLSQVESNVIRVDPLDLAFKHIENSTVIRFFQNAGVNLDLFHRLLWRHVIITELLKARYSLKDKGVTTRWLDSLFARVRGDVARERSLRYLRQWGDEFWLTTETRMREVTSKVERDLESSLSGSSMGARARIGASVKLSDSEKAEVHSRGSAIINSIQMRELTELLDFLESEVFDDPQKHYFLALDQLDEDWVTSFVKSKLIRALIEEIKAFRKVSNIKIVAVLREDLLERVYNETRDGGFQEEKYEAYYARIKWTEEDLVQLIQKRINEVFKHKYANLQMDVSGILPTERKGISAVRYILDRTFDRPRDVISYLNQCLTLAEGRPRISWQVIHEAEGRYSSGRLKSVFDEWISLYPSLERVGDILFGLTESFTRSSLSETSLNDLAAHLSDLGHQDEIGRLCEALLSPDSRRHLSDLTSASLQLLYRVGIIGVKLSAESPVLWSYRGAASLTQGDMKRANIFKIHKMFWRALSIKTSYDWGDPISLTASPL